MSFSGRLSIVDSDPHESVTSTSNSIIPLSIAQRTNMESPSPPSMGIGNLKRLNSRSHQKENRIRQPADNLSDQNYTPYYQKYKNDLMTCHVEIKIIFVLTFMVAFIAISVGFCKWVSCTRFAKHGWTYYWIAYFLFYEKNLQINEIDY